MRRILALLMMLYAAPLTAGTLHITCTAPTQNIVGTDCANPVLTAASPNDSLWVIFQITNAGIQYSRRDSVWRRPGGLVDLSYTLSPGTYQVLALTARKRTDGTLSYSPCDTTITSIVNPNAPFKVKFQ